MNMTFLYSLIYWIGYSLFLSAPRALEIKAKESKETGELANQSLLVVVALEGMLRSLLLLVWAVTVQSALGDRWYELLQFDFQFGLIFFLGAVHTVVYYFLVNQTWPFNNSAPLRRYRYVRNAIYSFLPGLAVCTLITLLSGLRAIDAVSQNTLVSIYAVTSVVMLLVGIGEGWVARRSPLGLGDAAHARD